MNARLPRCHLRIGERERPRGDPGKYRRRDVHFIGKKILDSYGPLMRSEGRPSAQLVRYEHVVSKPRETLETLARATGLVLSRDGIDNPVWLEADARHEAAWISELEGQGRLLRRARAAQSDLSKAD